MTKYKEEVYDTFYSGLESNHVIAALNGYDEKGMEKELDEVYRKAEAFDDIEERFDSYKTGVKEDYEKDMTGTNLHLLLVGAAVKNHFDELYVESEDE